RRARDLQDLAQRKPQSKSIAMKETYFAGALALVTLIAAVPACSRSAEEPPSAEEHLSGVPIGQLRGAVAISDTLRTRMLDDEDREPASFSVDRLAGNGILGLRRQLGVFSQAGSQNEFQGGTPTPFNMALWHQLLARFSNAAAEICTTSTNTISFPGYA